MILGAVILSALAVLLLTVLVFRSFSRVEQTAQATLVREVQFETQEKLLAQVNQLQLALSAQLGDFRAGFDRHQLEGLKTLQESLQTSLKQSREELGLRVEGLTNRTDERLKEISGQVEKRLAQGFEKTTEVFNDVIKRLALIDEAQKKITELSGNVVNLQEILADKRSRGAFGEVQLSNLVRNVMPEENFSLQHTFDNGKRADCVLFLPEPSGTIAIDAKFPLESYQSIYNLPAGSADRVQAERQFKRDIQKHIQDIAERYIIKNETADGAMMFIPAESVFAEIHAYHPDLVAQAQKAKVWMVSPTTMMAVLTTARAVLKDEATRKQVHIIQDHLARLAKDFERFQSRMDDVARHIAKAHENVEKVHTSARKITSRFEKIERVEVGEDEPLNLSDQAD